MGTGPFDALPPPVAPRTLGERLRGWARILPGLTLTRSIRNRLALLFFAITVTAIGGVYLYVTPSLESTLRTQKVRNLEGLAIAARPGLTETVGSAIDKTGVADAVRDAADRTGAHLTLLGISSGTAGLTAYPIDDSGDQRQAPGTMPLAMSAARRGTPISGTLPGSSGRIGVVAVPIDFDGRVAEVALFSVPLDDVLANVALIRRRVLIAGLVALVFAVLAGTLVARALSIRVKRLEQAARRVASGDFSGSFRVDSKDELGQLAAALDEMQHQLQELDTARKRFIATASHELRTPIFSLGGFLELIQDEELDEETRRAFVGQVRAQVDRLGKLATGLLDLSRLEAGSVEIDPTPTDLGMLARAVTGEFIPALAAHGSQLELRVGRDPVRATCDPERVAQVLRILIDNAITHTPPGTPIVVSAARQQHPEGAQLAVQDRGLGIPDGSAERIFDPFFTSDGVQGSGLGLAIARELADRMRAQLDVESEPGATTFTLGLPV
ncbi:MAG TPA: HAMP domain-containing sensor histidine kinase [Solirubrobacteraceae bacterium]|nr:HAMP domain-containing sensor histidine kinase [Solirubrobacteraceae bacterium]